MQQEEIWDVDAAQNYDTPGAGMFAPEVLGPAVDRLAELAGSGSALEFAIGTGRVAVPLAERGVSVTGIELSRPMVDQLRTKADEATIPVVAGDMAAATAPGKYTLRAVGLPARRSSVAVTMPVSGASHRSPPLGLTASVWP